MKTANLTGPCLALLTLALLTIQPAAAQEPTAAVTVPPAAAPAPVADAAMPVAPIAPAATDPQIAPTAGGAVVTAPAVATVNGTVPAGAVTAAPIGVPAAATPLAADPTVPTGTPAMVGQVMQTLQQSRSNVSVEDLSRAQDALARLDLLLQIEKKMGEIKQVQDERAGIGSGAGGAFGAVAGGNGAIISQVPASALVLPSGGSAPGMTAGAMKPPAATGYEVEQISGTNGDYTAVLRSEDGDVKTVKVGDRVEGRTVDSIGLDGVHLADSGKRKRGGKTLQLKTDGVITTPATPLLR